MVLDITDFASRHPDVDTILLVAEKYSSVLFEMYPSRGISRSLVKKTPLRVRRQLLLMGQ